MIKRLENYSDEERFFLLIYGVSYPMHCAAIDKENYEKYKNNELIEESEEVLRDVSILSILDELGYPMDELGTYFFKDMIAKAYDEIPHISSSEDLKKIKVLYEVVNNAFSWFYRQLAREDKEMGIKSFHLYVEKAIEEIDYSKVNKELSKKLFGSEKSEEEYGFRAFQIAMYLKENYSFKPTKEYNKALVKRMSSMPEGLELKKGF